MLTFTEEDVIRFEKSCSPGLNGCTIWMGATSGQLG